MQKSIPWFLTALVLTGLSLPAAEAKKTKPIKQPIRQDQLQYINRLRVPVYADPDPASRIEGYLPYAARVAVLDKKDNGWYRVSSPEGNLDGWTRGFVLSQQAIQARPVVHADHDYSVNYPDGWDLHALSDDWMFLKPRVAGQAPVAFTIQVGYTLAATLAEAAASHPLSLQYQRAQLEKDGQEGQIYIRASKTVKRKETEVLQLQFYLHEFGEEPGTTRTLEGTQTLLLKGEKLYVLTMAAPKPQYTRYQGAFQKILASFNLLKS